MAEFTILPVSAGASMEVGMWDEIRDAIMNRGELLEKLGIIPAYPSTGNRTAPTKMTAGTAPSLIANYRTRIDDLATFWYTETSIAAGGAAKYADADALHTDALGRADWDGAGGDDLTPPCPPHKALWNDMKLCLDKMKWLDVSNGSLSATTDGNSEYYEQSTDVISGTDWDTVRAALFSAVEDNTSHSTLPDTIGRYGECQYVDHPVAPDEWSSGLFTRDYADDTFATAADLTTLAVVPSVSDGYLDVDYVSAHVDHGGSNDFYSDLNVDIYLESTKVTGSAVAIDTSDHGYKVIHLGGAALATLNLDGSANDLEMFDADRASRTTDIGDPPWSEPAPVGGTYSYWYQVIEPTTYDIYLEFGWD